MSIYNPQNRYAVAEAYYAVRLEEFAMAAHAHSRCEIMYAASGGCMILCGERQLRLKEGQFVFLDQEVPHRLLVGRGSPCTVLNLEFSCRPRGPGADLGELRECSGDFRRFLDGKRPVLVATDTGRAGHALRDLIAELENRPPPADYLLGLLFRRMLIEVARCPAREGASGGATHLNRAVRFIAEHLFEELPVARVAAHAGVNGSYLQTLFSRRYGCGITGYINGQRLEHACFLLKNSDATVVDIAFRLGYNSRQHFGYLFTRRYGVSPKQYREVQGQGVAVSTGGCQLTVDDEGRFSAVELLPPPHEKPPRLPIA